MQPLWNALCAALTAVGVTAPTPPPLPHAGADTGVSHTLKGVGLAAEAAYKFKSLVGRQSGGWGDGVLQHEASGLGWQAGTRVVKRDSGWHQRRVAPPATDARRLAPVLLAGTHRG